ncbi:hypothetical protein [Paenibacillus bovis]|uniref:Uncharacterized protein n=1 Tax=Paenibacillus bovis TaxID=1616788 RepID=A0A172ZDA1_9BACL|nr:hypothetical protein [Paenibacillus bovis]ANF95493.1 hypothetical protein AR543_05345 [Paenibacillus bovis]
MNEPQTPWINHLPSIEECRRIFRSIAMLDAILIPEWEYRYYSFNSVWAEGEEMASMRDGEGSHYFALFTRDGLMIKGYDAEQAASGLMLSKAQSIDPLPAAVADFLQEPAFMGEQTTFCLWYLYSENRWLSDRPYTEQECSLLQALWSGASYYREWAADYTETEVHPEAVHRIFAGEPLTSALIAQLNPELEFGDLEEDIEEIDYPATAD